jgi:hypothetical protein
MLSAHRRKNIPVWMFLTAHGDRDRGDLLFTKKYSNIVKSV